MSHCPGLLPLRLSLKVRVSLCVNFLVKRHAILSADSRHVVGILSRSCCRATAFSSGSLPMARERAATAPEKFQSVHVYPLGSGRDCGGRSLCLRWRRRLCRLPSLWISRPCATSSLIAGTGPDGETSETLMTCRCFNHSPVCTRDFFFFFFFTLKMSQSYFQSHSAMVKRMVLFPLFSFLYSLILGHHLTTVGFGGPHHNIDIIPSLLTST